MEHIVAKKTYVLVWVVLMCLTALTAGLSTINFHQWSGPIAMLIATTKALVVCLFFMHVRYSPKLTWLVVIAGLFWLGILLVLSMSDYVTRQIFAPGR